MKLSNNFILLENHLLNIRSGDLYEIDEDGRAILEKITSCKNTNFPESDSLNFMINEGIIVFEEENKNQERFHLQWHITNKCNLRCTHCYDWKNVDDFVSFEQMLTIVDNYVLFLKKMELNGELSLTGGEPLIFNRIVDLIKYIKTQDVFIDLFILTNGTIKIEGELLDVIKQYNVGVQISLDGTKAFHDAIRGAGVFEKCIKNLNILLENHIRTTLHHVIMRKNVDDIEDYIFAMDSLGIKRIHFSNLVTIGPGAQEVALNPDEFRIIMQKIINIQEKVNVSIIGRRPLWALFGSSGFCPVGFKTLTINASGIFLPCRRLPIQIGDAKMDTFFKVWFSSEFLIKMRDREKYVKQCGTCSKANECGGCRAIAYALSGDAFAPDPSCWLVNDLSHLKTERRLP